MTTIKIAFSVFAGIVALVSPTWAQSSKSTTTVTLTGGRACNGFTQPRFDALSVASNISVPNPMFSSGQRTFSDIVLTKGFDDCSISMYALLFPGTHIPSVVISFHAVDAAGMPVEVLRITLTSSLITSISDTESASALPAERVTVSYEKIEILDPVTGARTGWDRRTNTAF
jgi:type VI protein secretion system component Hcp